MAIQAKAYKISKEIFSRKHLLSSDISSEKYETYKGCSYFDTAKEAADDIIGGVSYKTVKETCNSDNCNEKLYNKP